MICACAGEEVGNECTGLCNPLLVTRLWLEWRGHARRLHDAVGTICAVYSVRSIHAVGCEVALVRGLRLLRLQGISALHGTDAMGAVALLGHLQPLQRLVEGGGAICEGCARVSWVGSGRNTIERVRARPATVGTGHFRQRCACLVVWDVALTRVREEWEHGGNALRGGCSAGRDADQL